MSTAPTYARTVKATVADDLLLKDGLRAVLNSDQGRMRFCTAALAVGIQDDAMRLVVLKTMPYQMYLRTEHWRATSKAAKERASNRCQLCNNPGRLEVHHRTYARRGCEDLMDLLVLCDACHGKFHDELKLVKDEPAPLSGLTEDQEIALLAKTIEQKRRELGIVIE